MEFPALPSLSLATKFVLLLSFLIVLIIVLSFLLLVSPVLLFGYIIKCIFDYRMYKLSPDDEQGEFQNQDDSFPIKYMIKALKNAN